MLCARLAFAMHVSLPESYFQRGILWSWLIIWVFFFTGRLSHCSVIVGEGVPIVVAAAPALAVGRWVAVSTRSNRHDNTTTERIAVRASQTDRANKFAIAAWPTDHFRLGDVIVGVVD